MNFKHIPVLLEEAIFNLNVKPSGIYIDATIGGGGHTEEILRLGGTIYGIDADEDAILHLKKKFESEINNKKLILVNANFSEVEKIAMDYNIKNIDGILLDLGVSSYQIDSSGRGFSFSKDEPLDMRMGIQSSLTAGEIVNKYSEDELYEIFAKYGEEPNARRYAEKIIIARKNAKITTTKELVNALGVGNWQFGIGKIHPATRVFQALRIYVNSEIENLKKGLDSGFKLLKGEGRLVVISFHSLEDRVVKLYFQKLASEGVGKIITKKPIVASDAEIERNRRSRSAKMRILERIS